MRNRKLCICRLDGVITDSTSWRCCLGLSMTFAVNLAQRYELIDNDRYRSSDGRRQHPWDDLDYRLSIGDHLYYRSPVVTRSQSLTKEGRFKWPGRTIQCILHWTRGCPADRCNQPLTRRQWVQHAGGVSIDLSVPFSTVFYRRMAPLVGIVLESCLASSVYNNGKWRVYASGDRSTRSW